MQCDLPEQSHLQHHMDVAGQGELLEEQGVRRRRSPTQRGALGRILQCASVSHDLDDYRPHLADAFQLQVSVDLPHIHLLPGRLSHARVVPAAQLRRHVKSDSHLVERPGLLTPLLRLLSCRYQPVVSNHHAVGHECRALWRGGQRSLFRRRHWWDHLANYELLTHPLCDNERRFAICVLRDFPRG